MQMPISKDINIANNSPLSDISSQNMSNYLFYIKILYLIIMVVITTFFGLLPLCFNNCRKNTRLLNYANAFSGGIFLGIGFFHLFPEANENFEIYFRSPEGKNSVIFGWPMSYLLAFLSYSLILYLEKVAFNSHALISNTSNEEGIMENNLNEPLLENKDEEFDEKNKNDSNNKVSNSDSESIGDDEQIIRNVVSSKGQFSSLLQARNLSKLITLLINIFFYIVNVQGTKSDIKPDKNLMIVSKILDRNSSRPNKNIQNLPNDLYTNENNNIIEINNSQKNNHLLNPTSSITPYILLIALSVHGIFEGIALGVMNTIKDCSILFSAIILHKWAASFALGISFYKSGTERELFIKMILLFTSFGPLGIIIGMMFSDAGNLIKGVMLSISTGTFIYVAASEVIVEEFSLSKKTNIKFLWFLVGGLMTFILTFME